MSFNLITEGSKDYMKYVLQLSEAKKSSTTKSKKTPPADPNLVLMFLLRIKNVQLRLLDLVGLKSSLEIVNQNGTMNFLIQSHTLEQKRMTV